MSQTTFFLSSVFQRHRRLVLGLQLALLLNFGCAASRPAIIKGHDPGRTSDRSEPAVEPAMAANVAVKTEPASETDPAEPVVASHNRRKPKFARPVAFLDRSESRARDGAATSDPTDTNDHNSETANESNRPDSSMARLNAALTDEVLQEDALPQRSLTALDARVRVDALLHRSKQLLDIGQLEKGRQTALMAQELGESAQIDYSPDEDRPIDLIRRIDGQLEAIRLMESAASEKDPDETPTLPISVETAKTSAKSTNPSGKDSSGLSRIRRDWSTLFRREKKPAIPDTDPFAQTAKPDRTVVAIGLSKSLQESIRESDSGQGEAIVMANRSVSLGFTESVAKSTNASPATLEQQTADRELSLSPGVPRIELEMIDEQNDHETSAAIADSPSLMTESDDGVMLPPDFDSAHRIVPVHEVESPADDPFRSAVTEDDETNRHYAWTPMYVIFGFCSLLALACYRRGAT